MHFDTSIRTSLRPPEIWVTTIISILLLFNGVLHSLIERSVAHCVALTI